MPRKKQTHPKTINKDDESCLRDVSTAAVAPSLLPNDAEGTGDTQHRQIPITNEELEQSPEELREELINQDVSEQLSGGCGLAADECPSTSEKSTDGSSSHQQAVNHRADSSRVGRGEHTRGGVEIKKEVVISMGLRACEEEFECSECGQVYLTHSAYKTHMEKKHCGIIPKRQSSNRTCPTCFKELSSVSSLDRHMLVHTGMRPFLCKICSMGFTTNGNMNRHMKIHYKMQQQDDDGKPLDETKIILNEDDDEENIEKLTAEEEIGEAPQDDEADETNKQNHCSVCRKSFLSKVGLIVHMEMHPQLTYECKICGLKFRNHKGLKMHTFMVHKPIKSINTTTVPKSTFLDLNFADFSCGKFPEISQKWCEENHVDEGACGITFTCRECGRVFPCEKVLKLHEKSHTSLVDSEDSFDVTGGGPAKTEFLAELGLKMMTWDSNNNEANENGQSCKSEKEQDNLEEVEESQTEDSAMMNDFADIDQIVASCSSNGLNMSDIGNSISPKIMPQLFLHEEITSSSNGIDLSGNSADPGEGSLVIVDGNESNEFRDVFKTGTHAGQVQTSSGSVMMSFKLKKDYPFHFKKDNFKSINYLKTDETIKCHECDLSYRHDHGIVSTSPEKNVMAFKCYYCPYYTIDKSTFVRHFRTHNGERPFICKICKFAFTTKANCDRHVKSKHNILSKPQRNEVIMYSTNDNDATGPREKTTVCKYCNDDFRFIRALRHHLRYSGCSKKPFHCKICKVGFSTKNNCIRHIVNCHKNLNLPKPLSLCVIFATSIQRRNAAESDVYPHLSPATGYGNSINSIRVMTAKQQSEHNQSKNNQHKTDRAPRDKYLGDISDEEGQELDDPLDYSMNALQQGDCSPNAGSDQDEFYTKFEQVTPLDLSNIDEECKPLIDHFGEIQNEPLDLSLNLMKNESSVAKKSTRTSTPAKARLNSAGRANSARPALLCPVCDRAFAYRGILYKHMVTQHAQTVQETMPKLYTRLKSEQVDESCPEDGFRKKVAIQKQYRNRMPLIFVPVQSHPIPANHDETATPKRFLPHGSNRLSAEQLTDEIREQEESGEQSLAEETPAHTSVEIKQEVISPPPSPQLNVKMSSADKMKCNGVSSYSRATTRVSCPYCPRVFPWASSLGRHILTHTGLRPFKCTQCPLSFSTKSNRERHMVKKHGLKWYAKEKRRAKHTCQLCIDKIFSDQNELLIHYQNEHIDCNNIKQVKRRGRIPKHWAYGPESVSYEPLKEMQSLVDSAITPSADLSTSNRLIDKMDADCPDSPPYPTTHSTESSSGSILSLNTTHTQTSSPTKSVDSVGAEDLSGVHFLDYSPDNSNLYYSESAMKSPIMSGRASPAPSESEISSLSDAAMTSPSSPMFPCVECGKKFKNQESLERHEKQHNIDHPYECSFCSAAFTTKFNCQRHEQRTHGMPSPKPETPETSAINRRQSIKRHHSNMKEYSLESTDTYSGESSATKSRRVCDSKRDHQCMTCKKRFWTAGELKDHMQSHELDHPFTCHTCGSMFTMKHNFLRHVKTHHPEVSLTDKRVKESVTIGNAILSANKKKPLGRVSVAPISSGASMVPTSGSSMVPSPEIPVTHISGDDEQPDEDATVADESLSSNIIQNLLGISGQGVLDEMLGSAESARRILGME